MNEIAPSYKIAMRKNETGEIRVIDQNLSWHDYSIFWWTTGNFGCDCNRELEWLRSEGVDVDGDEVEPECGSGKFSVLYAELPDGTRITIDEES